MKLRRSLVIASSVMVLLGLASPAGAASYPVKPTPPVVRDCPTSRPVARPHTLQLACADGNEYLTHLAWKTWSATKAVGSGTLNLNDCVPYCAAGHFHAYRATVTLTVVRPKQGKHFFTRYSLRWTQSGKVKVESGMPISF